MESGMARAVPERQPEIESLMSLMSELTERLKIKAGNLRRRLSVVLMDPSPPNPVKDGSQSRECEFGRWMQEQIDSLSLAESILDDIWIPLGESFGVSKPGRWIFC